MNFSAEQLASLTRVYNVIKVFRDIDPNMSTITAATILEVALKGDTGVSVKYLEKALNIAGASASRQLQALEKPNPRKAKGFGLAEPAFDPLDAKGKLRVPLPEMEELVKKLQSAIQL